jgi:hypothetical protein
MTHQANSNQLRGRRWTIGDGPPVRFPAWRVWADSRVRMDDAILDSLAAMDLAIVALNHRSRSDADVVPDIFSDEELPYGKGFSVTVAVARSRLRNAEAQVVLNAFPSYVSEFDRLLGEVGRMLREVGLDESETGRVAFGLSAKVDHLRRHAGVALSPTNELLWDLLVAIRNSVVHFGASEVPVRQAWTRCGRPWAGSEETAQDVWSRLAERPLPLSAKAEPTRLQFGDREVVGCQRVLDSIGIDLASKLRARVPSVLWAQLLLRDRADKSKAILYSPPRNVRKLRAWLEKDWGVLVDEDVATLALRSLDYPT